jgi:hypothetical protein
MPADEAAGAAPVGPVTVAGASPELHDVAVSVTQMMASHRAPLMAVPR